MVGLLSRERIFFLSDCFDGRPMLNHRQSVLPKRSAHQPNHLVSARGNRPEYILLLYRTLYRPQIYLN
ncbi:hypothetical protein WJ966_23820 [Achromobacter xylosoxidans]